MSEKSVTNQHNLSVKNPKKQAGIRVAISCLDKDTIEEVDIETPADKERSPPPAKSVHRVDAE